ncbi:Plasmodium exported protein (PHISTb), unknown function [Plasmodium sp. DRC-Itaito]|nr:Plasmodium exported protein (PHISTb), unknown function [Plasmodium sp. DRC-Itaito]
MKESNKRNVHFGLLFGSKYFILCMLSLICVTLLNVWTSYVFLNYGKKLSNTRILSEEESLNGSSNNIELKKNIKEENESSIEELDDTDVSLTEPKKKLNAVFKENKNFFKFLINEEIYAEYELVPTNKRHTKYTNEYDKAINYELESIKKSKKDRYERMYQLWTRLVQNEEKKYILSVRKMFEVFNFIVNFYGVHYTKEKEIMNELRENFTELYKSVTPNMNTLFIRWITDNDVLNHGEFALLVDGSRYVWRNLLEHLEITFKEIITKHFRYQLRSFELERNLIVCDDKSDNSHNLDNSDNIDLRKFKKNKKNVKKKKIHLNK